MSLQKFAGAVAVPLLLVSVDSASAATVSADFDLASGGYAFNAPSLSYSENGINLTVSGVVCADNVGPNDPSCVSGADARIDRNELRGISIHQSNELLFNVDGLNSNEFLKLAFDTDVTLSSVTFKAWDDNDNAILYTLGGGIWTPAVDVDSGATYTYQHVFGSALTGSTFLIGALDWDDEWKLKGISVSYEISQAPLPATGFLIVAGIGALAAMRRRKLA